jgi:RNA polymerase sigma-70 factor, ECF subfamily
MGVLLADEATDFDLVMQLRQGDTTALDVLMERHSARAYRVAFGITKNRADAEEVVQDAFLALYQNAERFEGRAALSTWFYRVVTNAALMKRRGRRHEVEVPLEIRLPNFHRNGHRSGDLRLLMGDWSQDPESALLSQETKTLIQRAIEALPDLYRTVVVLRDMEGLSNKEVADIAGESVAAVKSRLHRARMALRESLTTHLGPRARISWVRAWGKRLGLWKR